MPSDNLTTGLNALRALGGITRAVAFERIEDRIYAVIEAAAEAWETIEVARDESGCWCNFGWTGEYHESTCSRMETSERHLRAALSALAAVLPKK